MNVYNSNFGMDATAVLFSKTFFYVLFLLNMLNIIVKL